MKPLLASRLKNQILAIDPDLQVQLRNISVNGIKMGCSGFVTDPGNDAVVYLDTDHNHGTSYGRAYYRTARDTRDFTGGTNQFSDYDNLARAAVELLKDHDRRLKQEQP